tara:strand:+ start:1067 stop:1507 length:441 start_codon:yes stop_codon:yes gene_type:complete
MTNQSTSITARLGGESQIVSLFGNVFNSIQNAQPNASAQDVTTLILNQYGGIQSQISPAKYDYIIGLFEGSGMNEQVSKAYALLCIDSVKTLGITFDKLFESMNDPISFSNLGLTLINHYRPITSQIGKTITVSQTPNHIKRMIAY